MNNFIESIKEQLLTVQKQQSFSFLLVGQTGRGKSSTINSLMGQEIAPTNEFEPQTMSVETYKAAIDGVNYTVIDTPGLCDDLEEEGNDQKYLSLIQERIKRFDCLWFVSRLDETRVTNDEKRALRLINASFGKDVWRNAIIVFTFADKVDKDKFAETLAKRTELIRTEIGKILQVTNDIIPSVAVNNTSPFLPNGKEWLGELYSQTFSRMADSGALAFLLATAERINKEENRTNQKKNNDNQQKDSEKNSDFYYNQGNQYHKINLDEEQKSIVKKRSAEIIVTLATTGAAIGARLGPVGAAIGGAIGATIGVIAWLWD